MSRISEVFKKGKALITFIMAGDPSLKTTADIVREVEKGGADIIELGVPFSDSIADGPVIAEAAGRAISKDVSAKDVIKLVQKIRDRSDIPLVLMTSYNIIYAYGEEKFINDCVFAQVDGLILPDLPVEEANILTTKANAKGLDIIFLVAPNSTQERIEHAALSSGGFIYLISLTGITGARKETSGTVGESVKKIRKFTDKPIAVGFGISTPRQAKEAAKYADGVIVGSAIVNLINKDIKKVGKFVRSLKKAIV